MKSLLLILSLFTQAAFADLVKTGFEGVRPTGMGNAFIATVDDDNAVWYNPAALANIRGTHISLIDVTLGADGGGNLMKVVRSAGSNDWNDVLMNSKPSLLRGNVRASLTRQYFSFAVYNSLKSYSSIQNLISLNGKLDIDASNDLGAIVGVGVPIDDYLSFGMSVKLIQRSALDLHLTTHDVIQTVATTPDLLSRNPYDYIKQFTGLGWGVGVNFGGLVTIPMKTRGAKWTLAATAEDFGATSFRAFGGNPIPKPIRPTYTLGSSLQYTLGRNSLLNIELDYRNAFTDTPLFKKAHFGVEYQIGFLSLRGGYYEGQPTYGLGLQIQPHTRIQASSYAIEAGQAINTAVTRWYLFELVIGFNPL